MKKQSLIILCISLFILTSVQAQWTKNTSIEGGAMEGLYKHNNTIYAVSGNNGDIYSTTSGAWTRAGNPDAYFSDPFFGSGGFKGVGSYLFIDDDGLIKRSANNAKTWEEIPYETVGGGSRSIESFGNALYVLTNEKLVKSSDNGNTFSTVSNLTIGFEDNYGLLAVANNKLYVISDSLIKVSTDGITFTNANITGLPANTFPMNMIGDGTNLYMSRLSFETFTFSIYKFNGVSWTLAQSGLPAGGFYLNLCFINSTLYVSAIDPITMSFGLYSSANAGVTWTKTTGTGLKVNIAFGLTALNSTTILGAFFDGIYSSTNKGTSWTLMNTGIHSTSHASIYTAGSSLITIEDFKGILKSSNGGVSFSPSNTGLPQGAYFFSDLIKSSDAFYTNANSVDNINTFYRSVDGNSWIKVKLPTDTQQLAGYVTQDKVVYLGFYSDSGNYEYYYTKDGAQTWKKINLGNINNIYAADNNAVYADFESSQGVILNRSIDNGNNWQPDTTGLRVNWIRNMSFTNSTLYLVGQSNTTFKNELYKRGISGWERIGGFDMDALGGALDKLYEYNNVIYCTNYETIYASPNKGGGFANYANGLTPNTRFSGLAFSGNKIYASSNNGIWSNSTFTGITGLDEKELIEKLTFMAFPNPATEMVNINYTVKEEGNVTLVIFDISGKKVIEISSENQIPGNYQERVNVEDLNEGLYLVRLSTKLGEYTTRLVVR